MRNTLSLAFLGLGAIWGHLVVMLAIILGGVLVINALFPASFDFRSILAVLWNDLLGGS